MQRSRIILKEKHKIAHMRSAFNYAKCSSAVRLQVGCIIVKDDRIISIGYNGTPTGWDNCCEYRDYAPWNVASYIDWTEVWHLYPEQDGDRLYRLVSKPETLHAETNAIAKLARSVESGEGAAAFITHQPCLECAKLLYQAGIASVYYCLPYRSLEGVDFLKKCGILVECLSYDNVFK